MTIYITILVKKTPKNNGTTPQIACHTELKYIYLSHCIYYLTCTESFHGFDTMHVVCTDIYWVLCVLDYLSAEFSTVDTGLGEAYILDSSRLESLIQKKGIN